MLKDKRIWVGIVLIFVILSSYIISKIPSQRNSTNVTPSLLQGSYNSNRSSHTYASVDPQFEHSWEALKRDSDFEEADERNPVYWNGFAENSKFLKNKRALIISTKKGVQAWDLDQSQWIWKVNLPEKTQGTPVIDSETGIIYLAARNWEQFDKTRVIDFYLFAVHIEGRLISQKQVPATFWSEPKDHPLHGKPVPRINCHTSIGINTSSNPKQIFMGCANRTLPLKKGYRYRDDRGVTGRVFIIDLNENGDFGKFHQFYTSRWTENPNQGFDSGVYNSGSGPTLLPDGSLLVATGNGPTDSKAGNFGCSVVRVNMKTLEPMKDSQGQVQTFGLSPEPYQECWSQNHDLGSSGVTAQEVKPGKWVAGVISKHAQLSFFDPDRMNQKDGRIKITEAGRDTYGSPASRNLGNGSAQFLIHFTTYDKYRRGTSFIGNNEIIKKTENFLSKKCIGWVSKKPVKNTRPLELLYTGPLAKRYTYAFTNSQQENLRSKTFSEDRIGWHSNWAHPKLKIPFFPHGKIGHFWTQSENSKYKRLNFSDYVPTKQNEIFPEVYYLPANNETDCEKENRENLEPIYMVKQEHLKESLPGFHLQSYVVDSDLNWNKTWDFHRRELINHQTMVSMWTVPDTGMTYVGTLVVNSKATEAQLLIIRADTGELVVQKSLADGSHFAMPMVVDEFMIIPTKDQGLFLYKFSLSPQGEKQRWKNLFIGKSKPLSI